MKTASDIDREAAAWVIRRDALGDAHSIPADFEAWLQTDMRHRAAFLRLNAAWEKTHIAERLRPLSGDVDKDLLNPRPQKHSWLRPWLPVAAVLAIAVAGLGAWWAGTQASWQTYSTELGAFERVKLTDGSTVQLNTNSEVRVRFTETLRQVVLKRGEAHFKVAQDAKRPFHVQAGDTAVRAVGTAFIVRLRGKQQVEVLVTEGRVALNEPASPLLAAGQAATVKSAHVEVEPVRPAVMTQRLAWTQGKLIFDEETLAEAVAEFNRYNAQQLLIQDPRLKELHVGGTFEATDPASFLAALKRVFGIQAQEVSAEAIYLKID